MSAATERLYKDWTGGLEGEGLYDHPHAKNPVLGCECDHCYENPRNGAAAIVTGALFVAVIVASFAIIAAVAYFAL